MAVLIPGIPGNDVYYVGLMTEKILLPTCCTQVLLLIFIKTMKLHR